MHHMLNYMLVFVDETGIHHTVFSNDYESIKNEYFIVRMCSGYSAELYRHTAVNGYTFIM